MSTPAPARAPRDPAWRTEPAACIALMLVGAACAGLLVARDRPLLPRELPNLTLPEADVRRVLEADAQAARAAPHSEQAQALEALLLEHGRAEIKGIEDADPYTKRREELAARFKALAKKLGEPVALNLRARAVMRMQAAFDLELPMDEARALLGVFPNVLAREGATRDQELVAPMFVVRTLFKARWNILHGLPPEHALARVERQAFYGWQALHAERVPLPRRIQALEHYAAAGGADADEALGILLFRAGDQARAAAVLEKAYAARKSVRVRNYALGARVAAGIAK